MLMIRTISINFLTCLFIFSLFTGCEKEINIDIVDFKPKIVVNALFQGGKKWNVEISKSKNVLAPAEEDKLDKAIVKILEVETGKSYFLESTGNGRYSSNRELIKSGMEYEIKAAFPGLETVSARAKVPEPVVAKVTFAETLIFNDKLALRVDFDIIDDPADNNYYIYEILNVFPNAPFDPNATPFLESPIKSWLSSVDGNTGYINDTSVKQSKLFLTDNNFRGSILNTSLVSFVEYQDINPQQPAQLDKADYIPDFSRSKLKVTAASEEMFKYYKSLELVIQKRALNSSISTLIKPYSNIDNGLGIFAGYNSIILEVE